MNATDCFALTVLARTTVNGLDWVLYSDDGALADATLASDYDDVPAEYAAVKVPSFRVDGDDNDNGAEIDAAHEHNGGRYSRWCSASATADRDTLAVILREAGIEHVNSGAHGWVDALTTAESVAARFNHNGQSFRDATGEHLTDAVGALPHHDHRFGDALVCEFADGSALAFAGDAWDVVGFVDGAWRSLEQDGSVNVSGWMFGEGGE